MTIRKLRFYCHKVLPLVYDESLSYYELLCKVVYKINEMIENPTGITIADPVEWSITTQYPANTMVIDSDGTAYLSKQPVPTGVDISDENYWQPIFNYSGIISDLREQIAYSTEIDNTTVELKKDDLVFLRGELYKATENISAGSLLIPDTNIVKYTVNKRFEDFGTIEEQLDDKIDRVSEELGQQIETVSDNLNSEIEARETGDRNLQDAIGSLPEHVYIVPEDYGAVGNGIVDDTLALQACLNVGKPVYLRGNYLISDTLTYSGNEIIGTGLIKANNFPNNKPIMLDINAESIKIEGIQLDANNAVCVCMRITAERDVYVRGVEGCNTNTEYYTTDYGSGGIYVLRCSKAEISECYIHDINRNKGILRTHSSYGIVVNFRNNAYVHDNLIERILCSINYTDCDGIYVTYIEEDDKTNAIVENNKIFDCTGRFIKSQTTYTVARNNYCKLNIEFIPNEGYFNCVSIQRGSFEIVNNYFNIGNSVNRGYTRCFTLEVYNNTPRTGIIKGNVIEAKRNGEYPNTIRNYFYVVSTIADNLINIEISDNIFIGKAETGVALNSEYGVNGTVKFTHNITNMYQVIECNGNYTDFDKIYLEAMYINNELFNATSRLSNETSKFKNLKYRFNTSLNEAINNYPIDYNTIEIFEGYYKGNQQPMQNVPSEIARGDYLFMIKSPQVTQYHNFANSRSGFING